MSLSAFLVQLLNGLAGASSLFLVAAGLSLIFGVTRIVNFAHGSFYMVGVYIAYALVDEDSATLFIAPEKMTPETRKYLKENGVTSAEYLAVYEALKAIPAEKAVWGDGGKFNQSLYDSVLLKFGMLIVNTFNRE